MIAEKHEQKAAELAQILKGLDAPQRFDQLWQWSEDFFSKANPSSDWKMDSEQVPLWRYALSENVHQAALKDENFVDRLRQRWLQLSVLEPAHWQSAWPVIEAWVFRWDAWLGGSALRQRPEAFGASWADVEVIEAERQTVRSQWQRLFSPELKNHCLRQEEWLRSLPEDEFRHEVHLQNERQAYQACRLSKTNVPGWPDFLLKEWAPVWLNAVQGHPRTINNRDGEMLTRIFAVTDPEQWQSWRTRGWVDRWEKQWFPGPDTRAAWRAFQMKGGMTPPASEVSRRRPRG